MAARAGLIRPHQSVAGRLRGFETADVNEQPRMAQATSGSRQATGGSAVR